MLKHHNSVTLQPRALRSRVKHSTTALPFILGVFRPYEHNRLDETPIVARNRCHMAAEFGVFVDEDDSKLSTIYWLPKLHKRPYKSRIIANSSSCTTSELSFLLTPCFTAIKNHVIKYCTTVYERNGKNILLVK